MLFTDWLAEDGGEARKAGIVGVEAVAEEIRRYLVRNGVYDQEEEAEVLDACLSRQFPARRQQQQS